VAAKHGYTHTHTQILKHKNIQIRIQKRGREMARAGQKETGEPRRDTENVDY